MASVKRHAYNADFKLKAIDHAAEHGNRAAARKFSVHESMVRKWRKQEVDLRRVNKSRQSFRGNSARWPQVEDQTEQWVTDQRAAGLRVSTVSIQRKASALAQDMQIHDFRGGPSWCFRFMRRRNISIRKRTVVLKQLPKDSKEKLATFRAYCEKKITERKIQSEHVTNMDEVPLTFDIPVNGTVDNTGTGTTGNQKSSFTVILGCQATGYKLPPMVIFKMKTLPKVEFPAGVIVKANAKGWMDEEKMIEWLREVYVQRPDGFFQCFPSLLICDSMRAHLTDTVTNQVRLTNSELAVVPGGLTKELQPLDMGINRAFKVKLRCLWERWVIEDQHTFTLTGTGRQVTLPTICQWVLDAWDTVSASAVVRAFTKSGLICELSGTGSDTDSDNEQRDVGVVDAETAQLFHSDTEDEEFEGFVDE